MEENSRKLGNVLFKARIFGAAEKQWITDYLNFHQELRLYYRLIFCLLPLLSPALKNSFLIPGSEQTQQAFGSVRFTRNLFFFLNGAPGSVQEPR